jgi:oligoendopeptidase F
VNANWTWDLSSYFTDFASAERQEFEAALERDCSALVARAGALRTFDAEPWEALVLDYEELAKRLSHLGSYIGCLAAADGSNESYSLAEGRVADLRSRAERVLVELRRGFAAPSDEEFGQFCARPALAKAGYALGRLRKEGRESMAAGEEGVAAELSNFGIFGWGRLYDAVSGRLTFEMKYPDGRTEVMPVAQRRSLMADADRRVREAAFVRGNEAWSSVTHILAPALNHIVGTRHCLNQRRGGLHFLDQAMHGAGVSRKTIDAMFEAVSDRIEIPRRGLRLKARMMGLEAISWFDLEAPFPIQGQTRVDFDRGVELVRTAFGRAYPRLQQHFDAMLSKRWIEAEPTKTKRPGAFCTGSDVTDETRVFMTFQGSLGDVSTLAHEVGHAFHAEVLAGSRVLERQYPMTLAETASTFAQAVLSEGLLSDSSLSVSDRALLLGEAVSEGAAFLLDVPTRFYFEKAFYEERLRGEVTPSRLSELMVEAQQKQFGSALSRGAEDPLFWASKLHFSIPDLSFYNFPYTFGFLLSRGMYALFKQQGSEFLPRYEHFLRLSGSALAHEVAMQSLGEDIEASAFWAGAIDTLIAPTNELEALFESGKLASPPSSNSL